MWKNEGRFCGFCGFFMPTLTVYSRHLKPNWQSAPAEPPNLGGLFLAKQKLITGEASKNSGFRRETYMRAHLWKVWVRTGPQFDPTCDFWCGVCRLGPRCSLYVRGIQKKWQKLINNFEHWRNIRTHGWLNPMPTKVKFNIKDRV